MRGGLRRAALGLALVATAAAGCAPAAFMAPAARLASELVGRSPRTALDTAGGGADTLVAERALPQLVPVDLATAQRLQRNGDTDAARRTLEALLGHDPGIAAAARLSLASLTLDEGQPSQAISHLQALLRDQGGRAERAPATYLLATAERRQGDLRAAIADFGDYLQRGDLLAGYVRLQLAELYAAVGAPERADAEAERALGVPGSRRLRIEALERLANAAADRGDLAAARARWEQIWPLAAAHGYRAEVLWQLASLGRRTGDLARAAEHYQTLVVDYPTTRRAADALRALNDLDLADPISYYQAGLVRYHQGEYERAIGAFDTQLALGGSDDELADASYYRALSLMRRGRESAARADFEDLAATFPASPLAPTALFRANRLRESADAFRAAADGYRALAAAYPAADGGQFALFRGGFALYRAGRYDEALAAWDDALPGAAARTIRSDALGQTLNPRAAILFWSGKALARKGQQAEARARWEAAAAAGPDEFYGLRARALLSGDGDAPPPLDAARLAPPAADAALAAWLAGYGADASALAAELAADPAWRRGAGLWDLGRRAEAGWEFDDLRDRFATDAARLYTLGAALRDLGADYQALGVAQQLWTTSGAASVYDLPRAARALLYPAPYAELVLSQASRTSVDPLLFYALMRQESSFNPRAESSAHARGLTQVIPSTARDIARALGRGPIDDDDLFKPAISIEFGAYYFGQALRQFRGSAYPALAGYNAGPGVAAGWLRQTDDGDLDLYAEQIPYAETATYVRRIYEYYRLYRDLYAG